MVALVLSLPIIALVDLIQERKQIRRITKLVCGFICVSCGTRLGMEALRLGNERWAAIVSELQRQYPDTKLSLVRTIHAVCPHCGCEYRYRVADRSLVVRPQH